MFVFVCAGCGAELTGPLSQVALPAHARQRYGNGVQLPVLMEFGTFAVDPDPWGGSWRLWEEVDPDEAEARGIYAPVHALSDSTPGASVIVPGDIRGTRLVPEKLGGVCCGLDGADGPYMACEACGLPVAARIDDCSFWQAVRLSPEAARRVPVHGVGAAPLSWTELLAKGEKTPPYEPIATWGGRSGTGHYWSWSPRWEAAAGQGPGPPPGRLPRAAGAGPGRSDSRGVQARARRPAAARPPEAASRSGRTGTALPGRGRLHPPRTGPSPDRLALDHRRPDRVGPPGAPAAGSVAVAGLPRAVRPASRVRPPAPGRTP